VADRAGGRRPLVVQDPEVTRSLVARFQIAHLVNRHPGGTSGALHVPERLRHNRAAGAVAMVSRTPFVFPSLGPTASCSSLRARRRPGDRSTGAIASRACKGAVVGLQHAGGDGYRRLGAYRCGCVIAGPTGASVILLKAAHRPLALRPSSSRSDRRDRSICS
jgi:hypothetical protein